MAYFDPDGFSSIAASRISDNNCDHYIVGAGISGYVYAFELIFNYSVDPSQIRFLEAQKTGGGRVQTLEHGGRIFNTGAHWFYGFEDNAFYVWLENLDKRLKEKPVKENLSGGIAQMLDVAELKDIFDRDELGVVPLIDSSGTLIQFGKFAKELTLRVAGWKEAKALYLIESENETKDISFKELYESANGLDDDKRKLVQDFLCLISSTWMGEKLKNISCKEYFAEPAGSGGLYVKGGTARVTNAMQEILTDMGVSFEFEHELTSVDYHGKGCRLTCTTQQGEKIFDGKTIYMTPSVGVLQSGSIKFLGGLPGRVRRAIKSLRMSNLQKVFVPLQTGYCEQHGFAPNTRIDVIDPSIGKPVFVHFGKDTVTLVGRNKQLSTESEEDLFAAVQKILAPILPGFSEQHMTAKPLRQNWKKNRFAYGSYSCSKIGTWRPANVLIIKRGKVVMGGTEFAANEKGGSCMDGAVVAAQQGAEVTARYIGRLLPKIEPRRKHKDRKRSALQAPYSRMPKRVERANLTKSTSQSQPGG